MRQLHQYFIREKVKKGSDLNSYAGSPTVATEKRGRFCGGLPFLPVCALAHAAGSVATPCRLRCAGRVRNRVDGLLMAGHSIAAIRVTPGILR
jgi:hypothetical protein